ncbi:sterol desaturase family protein [uncultured Roseovarius sp.]|uniref:sterol desaturase family protein n=1 Tax=uncultured Roseovarius sp. TaxID=293344 RepID=UPI002629E024|nr:sterol desaturase family protein [uncultured Roseovarius sp.]
MENVVREIGNVIIEAAQSAVQPSSRLWPVYLLITVLIAYAVFRRQAGGGSFLKWLLPRSIYFHASHIVDLKIFCLNRIIAILGVFGFVMASATLAGGLADGLGPAHSSLSLHPVAMAALLLIVGDFGTYWVHRIHHENRVLWPFHSLHHSAEVMTPITVYRKHPIYDLLSASIKGILIGGLQGLCLAIFAEVPSYATLVGINAGYALFNLAGANLRHSHVWLSFGPVLERIFISPCQHQIHHSLDPRHHNKNYGEVLAIWDWMFGTLYVPKTREQIAFGLGDKTGRPLRQRHDSLVAAMVVPVQDSYRQIRKLFDAGGKHPSPPVGQPDDTRKNAARS